MRDDVARYAACDPDLNISQLNHPNHSLLPFSRTHTVHTPSLALCVSSAEILGVLSCLNLPRFHAIMVYIRQRNIEKLDEYKYSGVDHSLVSKYILKPFYTHVVIKCFPMWMA